MAAGHRGDPTRSMRDGSSPSKACVWTVPVAGSKALNSKYDPIPKGLVVEGTVTPSWVASNRATMNAPSR